MAGYGPVTMVRTPWGNADTLRDRKLRPGRRLPAEEVARNQRERLFAALVAVVAEKGYEGTRVEDLLELSGSRAAPSTEHFSDKQDCLLAAVDAFLGPTIGAIAEANGQPPGEERAREAFDALIRLIVEQAAASRMCFVEIFAAGPAAVEQIDRAIDAFQGFVSAALDRDAGPRGDAAGDRAGDDRRPAQGDPHAPLPGRRGGTDRARSRRLWDWGLSYLPPPEAAAPTAQPTAGADRPASRATTRRSGSCARSPRSSPRRATRR